jgi:hypothetical protein
MKTSIINKMLSLYFNSINATIPTQMTPFIYSGENHTISFIYINNEPIPQFIVKVNKDLENHFFNNELKSLKFLTESCLQNSIPPVLYRDKYGNLDFYITKFYQHMPTPSATKQTALTDFFKALHSISLSNDFNTNIFYQRAIDSTYEIFEKQDLSIGLDDIDEVCFSYIHHGDLTCQNIIWTNDLSNPIIVDWEYSSRGWPFYDLIHYYLYCKNIFTANKIIKNKPLIDKIVSIIEFINNSQYTKIQVRFFLFISIYSYLIKFGVNVNDIENEMNRIADSQLTGNLYENENSN